MCGIVGAVSYNGKIDRNRIRLMTDAIGHRGPDDQGIWSTQENGVFLGLGHRRLAILDLSARGHQPLGFSLSNKNRLLYNDELSHADFVVVFNGEIYGYQKVRKELESLGWGFDSTTDTEVLVKAYAAWGESALQKLDGMFAFVIYDLRRGALFGARDRLGKKPLKYYLGNDAFIFASELKAIIDAETKTEIDPTAVSDFLTLQYVPAPATGFRNIYKLPHAHYFTFDLRSKKFSVHKYWHLDYSRKTALSFQEASEHLATLISSAVESRLLASDVEVGAFLSGGVDSSAVVAFAAKNKARLKTFTIAFDQPEYDESEYARSVSARYGTDHHEFRLTERDLLAVVDKLAYQYEEPYADSSALPTFMLAKFTSEYVKVALNGDGGDENFGGYDKYARHLLGKYLRLLPAKGYLAKGSNLVGNFTKRSEFHNLGIYLRSFGNPIYQRHVDFTSYFDTALKNGLMTEEFSSLVSRDTKLAFEELMAHARHFGEMDQLLYFDFNTYVPDDLMVKVDVATMASGLESRSPLLDYRIVEFAASLPFDMKADLRGRKKIFKHLLKDMLGDEVLQRKKKGFSVPLDAWFRGKLDIYINEQLLDPSGLSARVFGYDNLQALIKRHRRGISSGRKLWALLMLNLWAKQWRISL
jgi:asparagine synthase (glutamine-hydrolysing)